MFFGNRIYDCLSVECEQDLEPWIFSSCIDAVENTNISHERIVLRSPLLGVAMRCCQEGKFSANYIQKL